jgi:DDE superfamily endonuclease
MKTIVRRSAAIVTFLGLLGLTLHAPQVRHLERLADLLVVAPRRKTLAELAAQELDGVDASNLADFFRISPWDPDHLHGRLCAFLLQYLKTHNGTCTAPIFLSLDDSLANKDKGTRRLEAVDWFFDHKCHRTVKASNHVSLSISWGTYYFPLLERLYLRQATVRKRNRKRSGQPKLRYVSKLELARQLLAQISSLLPKGVPVYVLFDSWYTSAKLIRWIRQQGWHVIAGIKSNRKVSGRQVSAWHGDLKGRPYDKVRLGLANHCTRTYWVRSVSGRLRGVPGDVRILISQKGPGAKTPRYFLCSDTALSCQDILQKYQSRWRIETDYWQVKMHLGLGDYRLQSYEAIAKWYSVVYLVLTYLYWRKYEHQRDHGGTTTLSAILQATRREHQEACLRQACTEVAAGVSLEDVLQRYLGCAAKAAA